MDINELEELDGTGSALGGGDFGWTVMYGLVLELCSPLELKEATVVCSPLELEEVTVVWE